MKKIFVCFLLFFCVLLLHAEGSVEEYALEDAWQLFSSKYPSLTQFTPEEIAIIANEWGEKMAVTLSVSETIRSIDASVIEKLLLLLQEKKPQIFMRHGEQQKTAQIQCLAAADQKIEMMRQIDNMENPLTKPSIAEWLEGMIVWEYLKEKSGHSFILESSKNRRAEMPASTLAYALKTTLSMNDKLNCVNYPSSHEMSNAEILKWLPDGTLPWEKTKVDAIIGSGTYEQVTKDMDNLLSSCKNADAIYIAITHTQQINALASLFDLPIVRLGNFGFILLTDKHKEMFLEGFYKK